MKFYSEITKKMYDNVEDLNNDETARKAEEEKARIAEEKKTAEREARKKIVEAARKNKLEKREAYLNACKDYRQVLESYCKDYGVNRASDDSYNDLYDYLTNIFKW